MVSEFNRKEIARRLSKHMVLNCQSLEIVEKFSYLGKTIEARGDAVDCVITKIRSGWGEFRDLISVVS